MNEIWERVLANSFSGIHKSNIICSAAWVNGDRKKYTLSRQSAKLCSSRRNWDSPNPLPAGECDPPPPGSQWSRMISIQYRYWGEWHARWRERGWEGPNSDARGHTLGGVGGSQFRRAGAHTVGVHYIYIYVLCGNIFSVHNSIFTDLDVVYSLAHDHPERPGERE